jgi:hypothetical protein
VSNRAGPPIGKRAAANRGDNRMTHGTALYVGVTTYTCNSLTPDAAEAEAEAGAAAAPWLMAVSQKMIFPAETYGF